MTAPAGGLVTVAIPCRTDEPALGRTLEAVRESWQHATESATHRLELLVCLNGGEAPAPAAALRAFAWAGGAPLAELDVDRGAVPLPPLTAPLTAVALRTGGAGKPRAWTLLRRHARAPLALFLDADVSFTPNAFGLLLGALRAHPDATLASGKTTCAPRPGAF